MAKMRKRGRAKIRNNNRRAKKRVSILISEQVQYVDWKDYTLLRKFMSDRAKIRSRRVTGNSAQQQKLVADAIKLAREMALLPYASRVTTQRQHKERDGLRRSGEHAQRDGRSQRSARPEPESRVPTDADSTESAESAGAARRRDPASGEAAGEGSSDSVDDESAASVQQRSSVEMP